MSIVEFPLPHELVEEIACRDEEIACREAANSAAFLNLEAPIRDAALMADIVANLIMEEDDNDQLDEEHTVWAVMHLREMVKSLRGLYRGKPADEGTPDL